MKTCYYGQNDPMFHFSACRQDLKSTECRSVKLSAGYTNQCSNIPAVCWVETHNLTEKDKFLWFYLNIL